jgi:hypothetical protein
MILDFNSFIINEDAKQKTDAKSDIRKFQEYTKNQAEQQVAKDSKPAPKPIVDDTEVHDKMKTNIETVANQKADIEKNIKDLDAYNQANIASDKNVTDPKLKKQQEDQKKNADDMKKILADRVKKFSQTVKTLQQEKDKLQK